MIDTYLINYLKNNAEADHQNELARHIERIKIELDWRIYHYGDNFKQPFETKKRKVSFLEYLAYYKRKFFLKTQGIQREKHNVVSTVYFNNFNVKLTAGGFKVNSPVWRPDGNTLQGTPELIKQVRSINRLILYASIVELLHEETQSLFRDFEQNVQDFYEKIAPKALIQYTDQYYFSKVGIDTFKNIGSKTITLSHGLPGIYSKHVDNRSDFLFVWGKQIKANYVAAGFDAEKIIVVGHPGYANFNFPKKLNNGLSDIMVLAKTITWHQHTYEPLISDRGSMIVYLLSLQRVLRKLNIPSVRLRMHPSTNISWLYNFIDPNFFIPATDTIGQELKKSSLVIGPTSTVLLESLMHGVNYIVYEPLSKATKDLVGATLVPPFDGSDGRVPIAFSEDDLEKLIAELALVDISLLEDYMTSFDSSLLKDLIG